MTMIIPRNVCTCGKRCYSNEGSARAALIECQARGRREQRYYQCHLCTEWHLTKQANPIQKKAA